MYRETRLFYDWKKLRSAATDWRDYTLIHDPNNQNRFKLAIDRSGQSSLGLCDYGVSLQDKEVALHGPLGYFVSKRMGEPPIVESDYVVLKEGVKTPNFKIRCIAGEIISNPYLTYFGHIVADNVSLRDKISYNLGTHTWCDKSFFNINRFWAGLSPYPISEQIYYSGSTPYKEAFFSVSGKLNRPVKPDALLYLATEEVVTVGTFSDVTDISVNQLLADIAAKSSHITVNDDVVMECLEHANKGDLDILTAMAELPDTFQSIIDGFKLLQKIFATAEKKTILLHSRVPALARAKAKNAHIRLLAQKRKAFPPYEKWKRRNKHARADISVRAYNEARRDYLENFSNFEEFFKRKEALYRHQARLEVADAVASVHLNARYNIGPAIYTLQDLGEAILGYGVEYKRYRSRLVGDPYDFSKWGTGWTFSGENTRTERCFIKRQYDVSSDLKKLGRALMTDVVVTGYELIKLWSIIADWFFNIGNCLRAINWNPAHLQQVSSYSVKTEISGVLKKDVEYNGKTVTCKAHVTFNGYKRININPSDSIMPKWKPDFSLIRQLDALAFFWSSNRGTLRNYYAR